jgi:hypothetical protein
MKKILKKTMLLTITGVLAATFNSCSNDDDSTTSSTTGNLSAGDQYLQNVLQADADSTINLTYADMAMQCDTLYQEITTMCSASKDNTVTQDMVNSACRHWKNARARYEKSEAFLLGAAADYNIDPHIDTWPLDRTGLHNQLNTPNEISRLDGDDGISTAHSDLGQNNLGFHAVEFIIFRDGQPRKAEELNANGYDSWNKEGVDFTSINGETELIYAKAVAGDLRNSVYELEVCWNEKAPQEHQTVCGESDGIYKTSMPSSKHSYTWNLTNPGVSGSTYTSIKNAISAILVGDGGCGGISDEVGETKIALPHTGSDVNYIESPYSYNSLTDFYDNIQSIANTWYGGTEGHRSDYSLHNYFIKYNATLGTQVETAITEAQAAIKAIPSPFVLNYSSPLCETAINACKTLSNELTAANNFIQKNND